MKGFKLDKNGDVVIKNNDIEMTDGEELLRQTVTTLLGTNNGEWSFNIEEGIDFHKILIKNPDFEVIKNEFYNGLRQVDETFMIKKIDCFLDDKRKLVVSFTAINDEGNVVEWRRGY